MAANQGRMSRRFQIHCDRCGADISPREHFGRLKLTPNSWEPASDGWPNQIIGEWIPENVVNEQRIWADMDLCANCLGRVTILLTTGKDP